MYHVPVSVDDPDRQVARLVRAKIHHNIFTLGSGSSSLLLAFEPSSFSTSPDPESRFRTHGMRAMNHASPMIGLSATRIRYLWCNQGRQQISIYFGGKTALISLFIVSQYKWCDCYYCTSTRNRGQDLDPSNFRAQWPLDRTENLALTLDYLALTTPINRLESLWLFLSCPWILPWPLDQLQNFALTAWPHFDPGHGWEYSCLCSVPPLLCLYYHMLKKIKSYQIQKKKRLCHMWH